MINLTGVQPGAVASASPEPWLTDYFARRARLGNEESDFCCDDACTRPGCKIPTLLVPVSLVDLLGVALYLQEPLGAVYQRRYTLGLLANERNDWIRQISLRLNKPCPFLHQEACSIYPVRPVACMLFPEYLACENRYGIEASQPQFQDFLCLRQPIRLSRARAEIIKQLQRMWDREELLTNYYLFNARHCCLDFGNLTHELQEVAKNQAAAGADAGPELPSTIPNRVMEQVFHEHLADSPILGEVPEKIQRLEGRAGQEQFLQLFRDEELFRQIRRQMADADLTFRFKKGKLARIRQRPLPREYNFY